MILIPMSWNRTRHSGDIRYGSVTYRALPCFLQIDEAGRLQIACRKRMPSQDLRLKAEACRKTGFEGIGGPDHNANGYCKGKRMNDSHMALDEKRQAQAAITQSP